ncbi:MAG: dienelactone hydrolase family protein [Candidatus Binatia bacterium]
MKNDELLPEDVLYDGITPFLQQAIAPCEFLYGRPTAEAELRQLFSYATPPTSLSVTVEERWQDQGVDVERVSYKTGPLTRATATVLRDQSAFFSRPGLLLFHCHSGVYRWGSEKLVATTSDSDALLRFRQEKYAGRSLAHDFAKAGFLVVVPDTFYFGRRALGRGGIDAPEDKIDSLRRASEPVIAKMLTLAGYSWPAVMAWEDQRALDYLCSRPEVDAQRVGCLGLSLGGFQSLLLAARDCRIRAAVSAGWLTTTDDLLRGKIRQHSWMVLPSGLSSTFDIPSVAAAACPAALLVLLCVHDHLFTLEGMQTAADQLHTRYRDAGAENRCQVEFFASPHAFTAAMQARALIWLTCHLRTI